MGAFIAWLSCSRETVVHASLLFMSSSSRAGLLRTLVTMYKLHVVVLEGSGTSLQLV